MPRPPEVGGIPHVLLTIHLTCRLDKQDRTTLLQVLAKREIAYCLSKMLSSTEKSVLRQACHKARNLLDQATEALSLNADSQYALLLHSQQMNILGSNTLRPQRLTLTWAEGDNPYGTSPGTQLVQTVSPAVTSVCVLEFLRKRGCLEQMTEMRLVACPQLLCDVNHAVGTFHLAARAHAPNSIDAPH